MWLLHARTRQLKHFVDDWRMSTSYAILSHTWGKNEVSFDDFHQDDAKTRDGYRKIEYTCAQALKDGIEYVWVDTCCIDKRSSADLSEAINSMYRWCYNAQVCYAYLEDVWTPPESRRVEHSQYTFYQLKDTIAKSLWFTRGWTLQELIAPETVRFYDGLWTSLGSKHEVVLDLSEITGISADVLKDRNQLPRASIAQRMAWASRRTTSRLEDEAYCLLGLFDVNMPLMYGEGKKAFARLQEEIIQTRSWEDQDHTILAFHSANGDLLASSSAEFDACRSLVRTTLAGDGSFELSRRGLRVSLLGRTLPLASHDQDDADHESTDLVAMLNCTKTGGGSRLGLRLRIRPPVEVSAEMKLGAARAELIYDRIPGLINLSMLDTTEYHRMEVTIARKAFSWPRISQQLAVRCSESWLYLDAYNVCDGPECEYFDSCFAQCWTDEWEHDLAVLGAGKRDLGRINMGVRDDGKLFAIFKVRSRAPRRMTGPPSVCESTQSYHDNWPDLVVRVEADQCTQSLLRC